MLLFLLILRPNYLFSDGATGRHLAVGENILNNGVPHTDLISYTFADKAWSAYDWLFDALIAVAVKANSGSLNLLAVCLSSSIALLMVLLYGRIRKEGCNFASALMLVLAGCVVSSCQWTAVPYIATIFGVFFFASWLEDYWHCSISGKKLLLLTVLLMLVWVNVHPAFFIGIVLIAIYLIGAVILAFLHFTTDQMSQYVTKGKVLMCALLLCIAATFLSPYAFELQDHIVGNLALHLTLGATTKLVSPLTGGAPSVCLQLLYASFIVSLAITKRRLSLPRLVLCLVFTHLSLVSVAHMPLFVVVAVPAIAYLLSDVTFGVHRKPKLDDSGFEIDEPEFWLSALVRKWRAFNESFDKKERLCNKHVVSISIFFVLCSAALDNGQFFGNQVLKSSWSQEDKPTQTLAYLKENLSVNGKLDPERGLNYCNWGGYLHYLLGKRVFIDDRGADFYGNQFCSRYEIVALNQPGWEVELQGHIFDGTKKQGRTVQWILMPKNSSIGRALRCSADWGEPIKEDRASELFVRKNDPEFRDPELQNSVLRQE